MSPVKGKVKDVSESVDQTFAAKVLGEGIAVDVEDGNIYAPVDGTIMQVAETGHAITMELADGFSSTAALTRSSWAARAFKLL